MAFNRPRNSRDDKSGRSSGRVSNAGERPKRSSSTKDSSSSGTDQTDKTKSKKYSSERSGGKKSFASPGGSSSSSFSSGEKKSFSSRSKPYTGRSADNDDRPKRSFSGDATGEKRSFVPKGRPYTGRVSDNDERPKRSPGGGSSGTKKPFASRSKSSTDFFSANDKPKRSFPQDKPGDKKFSNRPSEGGGFKKNDDDKSSSYGKPQRFKPNYDKITPDLDAPAKTLRGRKKASESKDSGLIRLNRYISNAGICSRRKADELIAAGVVSVNGVVVSELGQKVDPQKDEIKYNGETLRREKMVYVLLNKPKDYITTTEDPQERRTVMHLVEKASRERIYPIGRLDRNTTGLLLMTNDGDLADKLSHPKNNIVKLYQVELNKSLTQGDLNKIGFGIELEDGLIKPDSISYVSGGTKREVGIQIHSGKNRVVRRIFEHLGYEVVKLDRAVYANLTKKDLPRGRWRFLDEKEVIQLKHLI